MDLLNNYFVCIEIDTTEGLPEGYPGLWLLYSWWEQPWSRVSFGSESIVDPTGQILLDAPPHKHEAANIVGENGDTFELQTRHVAKLMEDGFKDAIKRYARIRQHEEGSAERQAEIDKVIAEVREDCELNRPCMLDPDAGVDCTLSTLYRGNPLRFEHKVSGALTYHDPVIRERAATALGRYAQRNGEEFYGSKDAVFLGAKVAEMMDDAEESVRRAAAIAVFKFKGQPVPEEGEDVVALAKALIKETAEEQ